MLPHCNDFTRKVRAYQEGQGTKPLALWFYWSGRQDSNLRHPAPKAGALPGCATPRREKEVYRTFNATGQGQWRIYDACLDSKKELYQKITIEIILPVLNEYNLSCVTDTLPTFPYVLCSIIEHTKHSKWKKGITDW